MIWTRFNKKYSCLLSRDWGNSTRLTNGAKNAHFLLLLITLFCTQAIYATNIVGHVYSLDENGHKVPLSGANVYCVNNKSISKSDLKGEFLFDVGNAVDLTLIATFTGYRSDTILVNNTQDELPEFILKRVRNLQRVTVTASKQTPILSKVSVLKTETIN